MRRTMNVVNPDGLTRRTFLAGTAARLVGWACRGPEISAAAERDPTLPPKQVAIEEYSAAGERLEKARVAKVVKSKADWRQQLTSASFDVTRHAATERPFSGRYWNNHN